MTCRTIWTDYMPLPFQLQTTLINLTLLPSGWRYKTCGGAGGALASAALNKLPRCLCWDVWMYLWRFYVLSLSVCSSVYICVELAVKTNPVTLNPDPQHEDIVSNHMFQILCFTLFHQHPKTICWVKKGQEIKNRLKTEWKNPWFLNPNTKWRTNNEAPGIKST